MATVVTAKFFPKPDKAEEMNDWFKNNLSDTKAYEGCQLIKGGSTRIQMKLYYTKFGIVRKRIKNMLIGGLKLEISQSLLNLQLKSLRLSITKKFIN